MTAPARAYVRSDCWGTKFERERYGGSYVQAAEGYTDTKGARSYLVLTGPMAGNTIWFRDDQLTADNPNPQTADAIDTKGEW